MLDSRLEPRPLIAPSPLAPYSDAMSNDARRDQERLPQRVVELETLFTHLQRTVNELDQVVRSQQKHLESLERAIHALRAELGTLSGALHQVPKPEDERPPHY
jgi:uncharacterized coiled-coil protein SlyX